MGLNAREPKEQNLPYGRKKKGSISRISDEPRMVVALRSLACPRTQDSRNWAQKVDDNLFSGGWKTSNVKLRTLLVFIDNGNMFVGVHGASNEKYPLSWPEC